MLEFHQRARHFTSHSWERPRAFGFSKKAAPVFKWQLISLQMPSYDVNELDISCSRATDLMTGLLRMNYRSIHIARIAAAIYRLYEFSSSQLPQAIIRWSGQSYSGRRHTGAECFAFRPLLSPMAVMHHFRWCASRLAQRPSAVMLNLIILALFAAYLDNKNIIDRNIITYTRCFAQLQ